MTGKVSAHTSSAADMGGGCVGSCLTECNSRDVAQFPSAMDDRFGDSWEKGHSHMSFRRAGVAGRQCKDLHGREHQWRSGGHGAHLPHPGVCAAGQARAQQGLNRSPQPQNPNAQRTTLAVLRNLHNTIDNSSMACMSAIDAQNCTSARRALVKRFAISDKEAAILCRQVVVNEDAKQRCCRGSWAATTHGDKSKHS